ncbi:sugar phosphate isomerase/epimerase family protein [Halomontanus rarus]|uniref:sugar phosphate isomerase/epimerase family protein n=1 Tax=Halomontanus rarus TaxID=3034020 RepID=UPI0023E8A179|nr:MULTISPECIES: sugar phosphate isomerase/epimerase [unclassified Halovivax]
MTKPAVQFHVFQGSLDTHPELLQRVSDIGFEGVEFAWRLFDFEPEQVGRAIDRTGLDVVGRHVSPSELDETGENRASDYRRLTCTKLTVTHFDGEWFTDERSIDELATYIHDHADRLDRHGIDLQYHNNGADNVRLESGRPALEVLLEKLRDDITFELDVGHAVNGGFDPIQLLDRYTHRIDAIHFCDVVPGVEHSIALGQGEVELDRVLDAAITHDIDWVIYEGPHHKTTLNEAYERIQSTLSREEPLRE